MLRKMPFTLLRHCLARLTRGENVTLRTSRWMAAAFIALIACGFTEHATAQAISNSPTIQLGGRINYVATGGSLRSQPDTSNACSLNTTSSQALSGIPAGATIRAAYLYWGGSGSTVDSSVTLNGSAVSASRTFTSAYNNSGTMLYFFGGFADVTSRISGNATINFGGLSVDSGTTYCSVQAVLSGWGLVVIYERPASEPYRVINIFDGLQNFRGSSLTLTPTGFRIPASGIDGKMTVITWEGDPGNSTPLNGFGEGLLFNGQSLDDGIVPAGSDPTVQQFDGTINTLNVATSYGVDVDTYTVSSLLAQGQTSASTVYSAGGDLVLLTAQIVSVTSEPLVDLSITKTHTGNFTVGTNAVYTLAVQNGAGYEPINYPITVTDTLPAGLTYVSAVGTNWNCSAASQIVTCTHAGPLASGASLPNIALTVAVGNAAHPSVTNTATVSAPSIVDVNMANNSASDTATVLGPNLATSTKTVVDLNAGDANPGDTLRYTITLIESRGIAATGVSVTDHIPGNVSGFTVVSTPLGSINSSTGPGTGANNNGLLNVTNISVPANGSVTIVFDVQVAANTSPGATISNTATIANPAGPGATPNAPTLIVSESQIPGSGTKQLYLRTNGGNTLSRSRPTGTHPAVEISGNNQSLSWTITPVLQQPVTLQAGGFPVRLLLERSGLLPTLVARTVSVTLSNSSLGVLGTASNTVPTGGASLLSFNMTLPANVTAPAGSTFTLTVTNTSGAATRSVILTPYSGTNYSRVELNSLSVINVNSVDTYNAVYPGGATAANFMRGLDTVYVRTVVSDPFGSFDITSATVSLIDATNATIVNNVAMTQVADSGTATKTYQYVYAVPANAAPGAWTIRVTANEGVEGVTDLGVGSFNVTVPMPSLLVTKVSEVLSDPINGASNPKRIPLSVIRYTITVANSGPGTIDGSSLTVADALPTDAVMYVAGGAPIEFVNGATPSGLTYNYASHTGYSNQPGGGPPYTYTPAPDADGFDSAVTGFRVTPSGAMSAASGGNQPSFSIRFRVRIR